MNRKIIAAGALVAVLCAPTAIFAAAPPSSCDRACLKGVLDSYLSAVVAHDAARTKLARNVKYTENGVRLNIGDGLWQTAAALPTYRVEVIDEATQQIGLLGRILEGTNNNWYAVRLKVESNREISQIETLVNRSISAGPAPTGASRSPTDPHPLMMQEIPAAKRDSRATLVSASNAYFSGLDEDDNGSRVPFSPDCQRRENGGVMANNPDSPEGSMQRLGCKAQFDTGFSVIVTDIRERRFDVVDPVTGLAFGWGYFDHNGSVAKFSRTLDRQMVDVAPMFRQPFSFYIAEIFKVVDGNIRQIEAVLTTVPYQMESGW